MKKTRLAFIFMFLSAFLIYGLHFSTSVSAAATHTLTVQPQNTFSGQNLALATITSTPAGINCGQGNTQCSAQFEEGSTVTLTATVQNNKSDIAFRWQPYTYFHASPNLTVPYMDCAGMDSNGNLDGNTCSAPMPASDVTIRFTAAYTHSPIVIKKTGSGSGTVANQNPINPPLLINCGTLCSADISSSLILFAIPATGSVFAGWNINGDTSTDCGPTNYSAKCLASYQENVRGDGGTDTFIAVFNKIDASASTSEADIPQSPMVDVKIDNKLVTREDKPALKNDQTIVLSGKTIASGIVNIYIFSNQKTVTAIANKDGNWTYTVSLKDLSAGDHHIEADVTNPLTNKKSTRTQVIAFTIPKIESSNASTTNSQYTKHPLFIIIGLVAILVAGALAVVLYIRKHRTKKEQIADGDKTSADQ